MTFSSTRFRLDGLGLQDNFLDLLRWEIEPMTTGSLGERASYCSSATAQRNVLHVNVSMATPMRFYATPAP